MRVQCRHKHKTFIHQLFDLLFIRLNADNAVIGKAVCTVSNQTDRLQNIVNHYGLNTFNSKMSVRPRNRDRNMIPHDLRTNHCQSLTLCRVDLAGHDG